MSGLVIAIDGPAGSGKSTTSKAVARALKFGYLDTGALYRAMTWWMLEQGIDVEDADAVAARCANVAVVPGNNPDAPTIAVDGVDVSAEIRLPRVAAAVSYVARVPRVREVLLQLQRDVVAKGDVVVEGRDIGTAVAPDAGLKIFLTASPEVRAQRRAAELGRDADAVAGTQEAMAKRDLLDSTRKASPLAQADDSVEVDTSDLTLEQVVDRIVELAQARR